MLHLWNHRWYNALNDFRVSGVGAGSTPAIVLALVAYSVTLFALNWVGHKLKEATMNKCEKSKKSKSKTRTVKRLILNLAKPTTYFFEIVVAIGASAVATMASPLPTH